VLASAPRILPAAICMRLRLQTDGCHYAQRQIPHFLPRDFSDDRSSTRTSTTTHAGPVMNTMWRHRSTSAMRRRFFPFAAYTAPKSAVVGRRHPRPLVTFADQCSYGAGADVLQCLRSVLGKMDSTPSDVNGPTCCCRALPPPPPHPTTLIPRFAERYRLIQTWPFS